MSQVRLQKDGDEFDISLPHGFASLGDVYNECECVPSPHDFKCVKHLRLLRLPKLTLQQVMQIDGKGFLRDRHNDPERFKFTYSLQRADIVIDPRVYQEQTG